MPLFVVKSSMTEACINDITFCLSEDGSGDQKLIRIIVDSLKDGLNNLENGLSANNQFVVINKYLTHVSDLSWLEKKTIAIRRKIGKI